MPNTARPQHDDKEPCTGLSRLTHILSWNEMGKTKHTALGSPLALDACQTTPTTGDEHRPGEGKRHLPNAWTFSTLVPALRKRTIEARFDSVRFAYRKGSTKASRSANNRLHPSSPMLKSVMKRSRHGPALARPA